MCVCGWGVWGGDVREGKCGQEIYATRSICSHGDISYDSWSWLVGWKRGRRCGFRITHLLSQSHQWAEITERWTVPNYKFIFIELGPSVRDPSSFSLPLLTCFYSLTYSQMYLKALLYSESSLKAPQKGNWAERSTANTDHFTDFCECWALEAACTVAGVSGPALTSIQTVLSAAGQIGLRASQPVSNSKHLCNSACR